MRKQIALATCCLALSVSPLLAGCTPESAQENNAQQNTQLSSDAKGGATKSTTKANYKDGTYTGEANGMGGPITVTLTIVDGVITVDEITESGETEGIGGKEAVHDGTFKTFIEEAQSSDIDAVSGATVTSGAVKKATEEALAQAK